MSARGHCSSAAIGALQPHRANTFDAALNAGNRQRFWEFAVLDPKAISLYVAYEFF
jgi:hypothetical protein